MTNRQLSILTMVGGALAAVGSLLPWATISSGFGTIDVSGTRGDGVISLVLGSLVALIGFVRFSNAGPPWLGGFGTFLALGVLAVGIYDYVNLQSRLGDVEASSGISAGAGVGLYLVIIGGVLATFAGMRGKPESTPPSPPTPPIP